MMVQALSIRTKLIMAMLALVASVVLMGVTANAANAFGEVTDIRLVKNKTPCYVYIENHESGAKKLIAPYSAVSYNQWVPWATNKYEFNQGKYIELKFYNEEDSLQYLCALSYTYNPELAIWQEGHNRKLYPGDKIRYTRPTGTTFYYTPYAPPVAGQSNTVGRRNLIITYTTAPSGTAIMQAYLCYESTISSICS